MKKIYLLLVSVIILGGLFACKNNETEAIEFKVITPSGAPALAQIQIDKEKPSLGSNISYQTEIVSGASTLPAAFSSESHEIIFAPVNVGAKMYKNNQNYLFYATVTWGNLFIASAMEETLSMESLNGKDVILFGEGTINQTILNTLFSHHGVTPKSITYESGTDMTKNRLISNPDSIVLVAEPVLTAASNALKSQGKTVQRIDIQALWEEYSGIASYPQAGVFVNKTFYQNHKSVVESYFTKLVLSCTFVNENAESAATYATEMEYGLPAAAVLAKAIPNCNIRYVSAKESKEALEYTFGLNLSLIGGSLPDEGFYIQ